MSLWSFSLIIIDKGYCKLKLDWWKYVACTDIIKAFHITGLPKHSEAFCLTRSIGSWEYFWKFPNDWLRISDMGWDHRRKILGEVSGQGWHRTYWRKIQCTPSKSCFLITITYIYLLFSSYEVKRISIMHNALSISIIYFRKKIVETLSDPRTKI